jgi:hypothetical protein
VQDGHRKTFFQAIVSAHDAVLEARARPQGGLDVAITFRSA